MLDSIKSHLNAGYLEQAQVEIEGYEKRYPDDPWILFYKALLYQRTGELEDAYDLGYKLVKKEDPRFKAAGCTICAYVLWRRGQLDKAEKFISTFNEILEQLEPDNDIQEWQSTIYNVQGNIYWKRGNLEQALTSHQSALVIRRELKLKHLEVYSLNNIGTIHYSRGQLDEALEYFTDALKIEDNIQDKTVLATLYSNIASIHSNHGKFEEAVKYNLQAYEIRKTQNDPQNLAYTMNNIGTIYFRLGKYDLAKQYFDQTLTLRKSIGNPLEMAAIYSNQAKLHYFKNELDKSLELFSKTLEMVEPYENELTKVINHYWITRVLSDLERPKLQEDHLESIKRLVETSTNPLVHDFGLLAEGYVKAHSHQIRDIVEGQELLSELVKGPTRRYDIKVSAILLLIELMLREAQVLDQEATVIEDTISLLDQIYQTAQDQKSISLVIEILRLKAVLLSIGIDVEEALLLLEQADLYAMENNMEYYKGQLQQTKSKIEENILRWKSVASSSIFDRIEEVELKSYINSLHKLI